VLKKLAALGLTAAILFAPVAAFAQAATPEPTPGASPDAASTETPKPMKKHKMKHHTTKHMMKKKKMAEPAPDATPTEAPK